MRYCRALLAALLSTFIPTLALAEGVGGGYRGIATMYYSLITVVLIFGVYDVFGRKAMYIAGPLIAIAMYLFLPEQ